MMRAIKLGTLFPADLNLNGDQGNLLVLRKQLEWAGLEVQVLNLDNSEESWPDELDFLLIGHGSRAAWQHVWSELHSRLDWLKANIARGLVGLAVGSGHEIFYPKNLVNEFGLGLIYRELAEIERESRFCLGNIDGVEVLGYLNRNTDAPIIERLGSFLLTGLHGPVLAKNETLLRMLMGEMLRRAEITVNSSDFLEQRERASRAVAMVWKLEEDLARE